MVSLDLPLRIVGQQLRLLVGETVRVDLVDVALVEQVLGVAPQVAPKTLLAVHLREGNGDEMPFEGIVH